MKIKVNHVQSQMLVPVWFGQIKGGYVYKNGNIDLANSREHYNYHYELRRTFKNGN